MIILEPVEKHLDEQIEFAYTIFDAAGNRQSMGGVSDLRLTVYRQSDMAAVVTGDSAHCTIEETGVQTYGDVRYSRPPDGVLGRGRYWCKFLFTLGGIPLSAPEDQFIPLIIT